MSETKVSGLLLLSDLYRSENQVERGLGVLERLSAEAPAIAELEFVFGSYLGDLERYTEAEAHLLRAIEIKPEMLQSYLYLGSLYVVTERTDEGAIMFGRYENVLLELLTAVADETGYTVEQRVYVLASLLFANPDERITRAAASLLNSDDIDITVGSIQVLSEIGTAEGIPALEAFAAVVPVPALAEMATHAAQMIRERGL
jgi:tetratricopeptide (TPR) repeat protein